MRSTRTIGLIGAFIMLIGGLHIGSGTSGRLFAQYAPPPMPGQERLEVLTSGPVHEAFAEPVPLEVEAGLIVPLQPPANIEEIPPAERPVGGSFVWVPGYWGWDADRNDFVWVSACWRAAPPNTYWVPGYWYPVADAQEEPGRGVNVGVGGVNVHVGGGVDVRLGGGLNIHVGGERPAPVPVVGWEWVSGFWAPTGAQEIEYLPAPPAPMDLQPPGSSPYADGMWVPGCWYWQNDQYVRRPGYWMRQQPNWVWVPSHYRWTPRGYVFESGHWDYSLERRGVLFAPVYFPRSVYSRRGFAYTPTIAIDLGVLSVNLFAYPRYSHYYFGDYYDDAYLRAGIYPQFESQRRHTWYDPIYTYDRWHHGRTDSRWEEHQRQEYDHRRSDKNLRPARTYREMETRSARMPEAQRRNVELARPFQTIVARKSSPIRYERINTDTRQRISRQAADTYKLRDERVQWEASKSRTPDAVRHPAEARGNPSAEHRGPVTPSVDRGRGTVTPPVDRGRGTVTPPVDRSTGTVTPSVDRGRGTVTPPVDRSKGPERPSAGQSDAPVPPRQVHLTKPERVRISSPPPAAVRPGRTPGDVEKGPPDRPNDERKFKNEDKGPPREDLPDRGKGKDKDKDKGKDKDKDTRKNEGDRKDK